MRWLCLGLRRNKGGPDQSWWSWHCFQATCWDEVTWVCGTHSSFALQKISCHHLFAFNSNTDKLLCSKELSLSKRDLHLKFILSTNNKIVKLNQTPTIQSVSTVCFKFSWQYGEAYIPCYSQAARCYLPAWKRKQKALDM